MSRVIIFGYYGRGNLGDETNLRQLVNIIRGLESPLEISVVTANPEETAQTLHVDTIAKLNIWKIIRSFRHSQILIGGGGSLFQDQTSQRSLVYYATLLFMARLYKLKIFLYGQGIGPLRTRMGRWIASKTLNLADMITVRDRLSIILSAELGIHKPEIHLNAEPLLALEPIKPATVTMYWSKFSVGTKWRIGLVLREFEFLGPRFWSEAMHLLQMDSRVQLYLIAFAEADIHWQNRLAMDFQIPQLPFAKGWEQGLMAIGGLNFVVSARLHGLVAGLTQSVPCFGLVSDSKLEGFCSQAGIPFIQLGSRTDSISFAERILKQLEVSLKEPHPNENQLPLWKVQAAENGVLLKRFIERHIA